MRTTKAVLFAALLAATGCAASAPDENIPDDPSDSDDPSDPDEQPVPLTPEGTFRVQSDFDLATNVPGTAGQIANYFILATDDPDDPAKFLVEKIIEALPNGSVKDFLADSAPFVTGYLNDRLLEVAPELLERVINMGDAFGQVARHFGTIETLAVSSNGQATKTVTGVHFKVDNVDLDFPFADYGMDNVEVTNLTVGLDQAGKLTISQHQVGLSYGKVLRLALDNAIIPFIDPSASNVQDILVGAVNCEAVGAYVYEAIDFGSASTFESACNTGLALASNALYGALDNIDGNALTFGLAGTARGVDTNRDGKMDSILTGTWAGDMQYAGTPAALGTAKFNGAKM